MEVEAKRKTKCVDALKHCEHDPIVLLALARFFWSKKSISKAREWFSKCMKLDPDLGDAYAHQLKFEILHGTEESQDKVRSACAAAEPRHGQLWCSVSKDVKNWKLKTNQILEIVCEKVEVAVMLSSSGKARLLCLHGYQQSGEIFRTKSGHFRKGLKSVISDFECMDGTYLLNDGTRGWRPSEGMFEEEDAKTAVDAFSNKWLNEQPFDGILGFSQAFETAKEKSIFDVRPLKFVIFISAYNPLQHQIQLPLKLNVPSLHIYGLEDKVIQPERSISLCDKEDTNLVQFVHPGGHFIPKSSEFRMKCIEFIRKCMS